MGRDHSIECEVCGADYDGLNETPHECTGPHRVFPCPLCNGRVKSWCNKPGATAHDNCLWLIGENLQRLAANIGQAAALERARVLGIHAGYVTGQWDLTRETWSPNTEGKGAP